MAKGGVGGRESVFVVLDRFLAFLLGFFLEKASAMDSCERQSSSKRQAA